MTVGELKQRMTQAEINQWLAYVEKNGPLNASLRVEAVVARVAAPFLKNMKPRDLMTWPKEPEPVATPETMLLLFKNLAQKTKDKR